MKQLLLSVGYKEWSVPQRYSYRNLIVWQRAQALALTIIQIVQRLPQDWGSAVIARQIISSATSIGANIAEGHGRFTFGAHRNHLSIAKGSVAETDSWLDLLRRGGWLTATEEEPLHLECIELMAMLTSKIRELERMEHNTESKVREDRVFYAADDTDGPVFPFTYDDYQDRTESKDQP